MLFYAISSLVLKSGFRSKDFLLQRSHRNYRPKTGRKSNEAKQMRFLYFTYNVVLLHRKWKKSIFHRKSTGRFLHGMPLNWSFMFSKLRLIFGQAKKQFVWRTTIFFFKKVKETGRIFWFPCLEKNLLSQEFFLVSTPFNQVKYTFLNFFLLSK